jgi:hypothetical protein
MGKQFARASWLLFGLAGLLLAIAFVAGCQQGEPSGQQMGPSTVIVAKTITKQIVEWDAYTGRLEVIDVVEVRARVSGYLQSTSVNLAARKTQPFSLTTLPLKANIFDLYSQTKQAHRNVIGEQFF